MSGPLLALEGLQKRFGALVVSDGVSLNLEAGQIHALIGPNGAGKTTLMAQIDGSLPADAGRILLDGEDITPLGAAQRAQRGLARTFQITSIFPAFTVLDNVALAVQARDGTSFRFFRAAGRDRRLNRLALETLERVGLAEGAWRPAGSLSHGEKRALELAMALASSPRLLLLDEPMAGTGPEETDALIATLESLRGEITMLLVEHDMTAVFALADRISVLVEGRIRVSGDPATVRADPAVQSAYLGEEDPHAGTG